MIRLQRGIGLLALIALFLGASIAFGQEVTPESAPAGAAESLPQDETIRVVGSGIVIPAFEALSQDSAATGRIETSVTGTVRGFEAFCNGNADITLAPRAMNESEFTACSTNGTAFIELLLGYNAVALISSPDAAFGTCLNLDQLNVLLAPSAAGQITNWRQINPESPANVLSIVVPSDSSAAYALIDGLIEGDGLRSDAVVGTTDAAIDAVLGNPNALAIVNDADLQISGADVRIIEISGNAAGCLSADAETIADETYVGSTPLYAYVNPNSLSKAGLEETLASVFAPSSAAELPALGIVAPLESGYAMNAVNLAEVTLGRTFSAESADFSINPSVAGFVSIAGSAAGRDYISGVTGAFVAQYPSVTTTVNLNGQVAGARQFCNGEVELLVTEAPLTQEQLAACEENEITPYTVNLGAQAVVLAANAASSYLQCLTPEALTTAFTAASAHNIVTWNQVDESFPENNIYLFVPTAGNAFVDLMMIRLQGTDIPARIDDPVIQQNDSADYRAAAAANTPGAIAFFTWNEYLALSSQDGLQLIAIERDGDCITPDSATIADGTYLLARPLQLLVSTAQLTRADIQSLLWYIASDEQYGQFETANLTGIPFAALGELRVSLQTAFDEAQAAAVAAAEEAAAQAAAEAEATPEPEATESAE